MTTGKTIALTIQTFVFKVMSLFFNMLSRYVISYLPRSKSSSAVILEPKKIKSATVFTFPPSICHEVMGPDVMILVFQMLSFKLVFSFSSFTLFKRLFSSSSLSAIRVVSSAYLRLLIFLTTILTPVCETFRRKESLKWIKKDGEVLAKWNRDWSVESSIQRNQPVQRPREKKHFLTVLLR